MRVPRRRQDGFGESLLPYLNAAFNLARWLTRNHQDAEDIVQEAVIRALRYQDSFRGGDLKAWLLTIVRNTAYTSLKNRPATAVPYDEASSDLAAPDDTPEAAAVSKANAAALHRAINQLPLEFREALVLRELEGLSYKEIAAISGVPMGTVMSRLSRARALLQEALAGRRGP